MGYLNEFPHVKTWDSDLRQILEMFEDVKGLPKSWEEFSSTMSADWSELKEFVTSYFDDLDVQNEINNKIDALVNDGTIETIMQRLFDSYSQEVALLNARMDTFTALPEGSTSADAELADIRVDFTGKVWDNAGAAVRGVTSQLSSEIAEIEEHLFYTTVYNSDNLDTDINPISVMGLAQNTTGIACTEIKGYGRLTVKFACRFLNGVLQYPTNIYLFEKSNNNLKCVGIEGLNFESNIKTGLSYEWRETTIPYLLEKNKVYHLGFDRYPYTDGKTTDKYYAVFDFTNINVGSEYSLSDKDVLNNGLLLAFCEVTTLKFYNNSKPTISILGDSLTEQGYYTNALKNMGYSINNHGLSGTTISSINPTNPFYERINSISENCDFILVVGGTNDWGLSVPLGEKTDKSQHTFYGGLFVTLTQLRRKFPTKTIFVSEILQRNWTATTDQASGMDSNANGNSIQEFNEAIRYMAERLGCFVLPSFSFGLFAENLGTYTSDGLHLNTLGGEKFAQFLDKQFSNYPIYTV